MKQVTGNTLVKFIAALLCVALLTGCVWFMFFGAMFTVMDRDDVIENIMGLAMDEATAMAYYHMDELEYMQENPDGEWSSEYIQELFDPELTNFRYRIIRNDEVILSNFDPETQPYLVEHTNWERRFVGTELQRERLWAYETGSPYNFATDEYLPERGHERYTVTEDMKLDKAYVSYDENGYLYDKDGNAVAIVKNFDELSWTANAQDTALMVDGTAYYPIDLEAGYPEDFAYINEYGKIFDRDLNYIMTEEQYRSNYGYDDMQVMVSPTPTPQVVAGQTETVVTPASNSAVKPEIVELGTFTQEDYNKLYEECYAQYWIVGYLALEEVPVDSAGEPVTELALAVSDRYSELYNYLLSLAVTPSRLQLQNGVFCGIAAVLILIFLMMAAGHRTDSDEIVLRVMDRMPWDLWLVLVCCVGVLCGCGVVMVLEFGDYALRIGVEMFDLFVMYCIALAALTFGFCVWMLLSFAARVKVKGWWRNCLCGGIVAICWKLCVRLIKWCWKLCIKIVKWSWKLIKNFFEAICGGLRKIPLIWKAVVVFGTITVVEMVYCAAHVWSGWAAIGMLWVLVKCILCLGVCLALKRLQEGARVIADGDLTHRISLRYLYGDFREHAENLNRIGDGLSRSVDSQLRAERMKTELITNVSHDLKTPLTSIVSYVDLLKKENLTGTAGEYVEVLDRQSARLKKLTEDLVEASKASSGSLNVAVERVHLGELVEQAQAEYAKRLEDNGLRTIINLPAEPVEVWADGKYVWRILDNLLSNVCKYAMPETRVYVDVRREGDCGVLSVKNISRECLNISSDELMERFVRGDSSRTTEGSGLGLSIAQSLAKLMGGQVSIVVDGDLFKAEVRLPLVK